MAAEEKVSNSQVFVLDVKDSILKQWLDDHFQEDDMPNDEVPADPKYFDMDEGGDGGGEWVRLLKVHCLLCWKFAQCVFRDTVIYFW